MITFKTLPQATAQEVFDQVAKHLFRQGEKSRNDIGGYFGGYAYHGNHGRKCSAGCLISEDEYDSSFEGAKWGAHVRSGKVPLKHFDLIATLQEVHDFTPVKESRHELESVAINFALKFNH